MLRALEQRCGCLVALGAVPELEKLLERAPHPGVRYHLALAYALDDRIDQAVEQAKLVRKEQADYPGLSTLTFRLAMRQADLKLKHEDWNAIASAVALALETDSPEAAHELQRFQSVLPVANVKAGNRRDAAEAWERELRTQPGNRAAVQNLGILYYWWAMREEAAGGSDVDRLWMAAIAYWTAIVNSDAFWAAWKDELEQRCGIPLQDADLQAVRDTFLDERLLRVFQNYSSSYKETNRLLDSERHEDYFTAALLEKKSAEAWKASGARFPSGGVLYCQRMGLTPEVLEQIDQLPETQQRALAIYFSTAGLGQILILIEDQGLPEKALQRLASLPQSVLARPEAKSLHVRALFEFAKALRKRNAIGEALSQMETAWTEAQPLDLPLKNTIGELLDTLARQEATRLRQEGRIDEAIGLLDRLHALTKHTDIREYLCILYCDQGFQKLNEKQYEAGRADFQKALSLDASYQRARQALCIAYNNEALATPDQEARLKLMQKALEFNPNDQQVRENLSFALYDKGLKIANGRNDYNAKLELARAIGLFRAAAATLRADLPEKTLDAIVASGGQGFEEEFKKLPEGLYRTVLENLGAAAKLRKQVKR